MRSHNHVLGRRQRFVHALLVCGAASALAVGVPAGVASAAPDRGPHKSTPGHTTSSGSQQRHGAQPDRSPHKSVPGGTNNDNHRRVGAEPDRSPHKSVPGDVSTTVRAQTNRGRLDNRPRVTQAPSRDTSQPSRSAAPQSSQPAAPARPAAPAPAAPPAPATAPPTTTLTSTDPWASLPKLPPPTATTQPADGDLLPGDVLRSTSTGEAGPSNDRIYHYPLTDGSYGYYEERSTRMGTDRVLPVGAGPATTVSIPDGAPGSRGSIFVDGGSGSFGASGDAASGGDTFDVGAAVAQQIRVTEAVPTRTSTVVVDGVQRQLVHYDYRYQTRKDTLFGGSGGAGRIDSPWQDTTAAQVAKDYQAAKAQDRGRELPQMK